MADYAEDVPLASAVRLPEITGAWLIRFVEYFLGELRSHLPPELFLQ